MSQVRSLPTSKQLSYLDSLITRAGMTRTEWRESVGLLEHSPWGVRLRTELITRSRVSIWIDALVQQVKRNESADGNPLPGDSRLSEGS